jgi:hypothetical protein
VSSSEAPRELAAGPQAEPELLTIPEAVARFEVGANTLRRWLQRGELEGARKVPGPQGETYRIPLAALVARGLKPRGGVEAAAAADPLEVAKLRIALELEEQRRADVETQRASALAQLDTLRIQLDAEREKLELLTAAQQDLRRALLILESAQQKQQREEAEAARGGLLSWLRHRREVRSRKAEEPSYPAAPPIDPEAATPEAIDRLADYLRTLPPTEEQYGGGEMPKGPEFIWEEPPPPDDPA